MNSTQKRGVVIAGLLAATACQGPTVAEPDAYQPAEPTAAADAAPADAVPSATADAADADSIDADAAVVDGSPVADVPAVPKCQIAADCNDKNGCTTDTCDAVVGCKYTLNVGGCDDGSKCTTGDVCKDGACSGGKPPDCDDKNPCTEDKCDDKVGCKSEPTAAPCDDANACTEGEKCDAGACTGKPKGCDDANPCTQDGCDKVKGCTVEPFVGACDDGDACTEGDACKDVKCAPGIAKVCDDGKVCTKDACDKAKGCTAEAQPGPCDDGSKCTLADACQGGACLPGAVTLCDDQNGCTNDTCDAKTGCANLANTATCTDGNACTAADVCKAGNCSGKAVACNDGNPCTSDACLPAVGCTTTANDGAACDDDNPCTQGDSCAGASCQAGKATVCPANEPCIAWKCDPVLGKCKPGYLIAGTVCNDGNACSEGDACAAGACQGKPLDVGKACDDGNVCTTDGCQIVGGCTHGANGLPCDDGNACTKGDACAKTVCGGLPVSASAECDDGKVCTDDGCEPKGGCTHGNNVGGCSDGNACTVADACANGSCKAGALLDADGDGVVAASCGGADCDDGKAAVKPGATEVCDDVDNNCAAGTDEGCDDDNDDYCDAAMTVVGKPTTCSKTDGGVSPGKLGNDCNDSAATGVGVNPGKTEICNNVDDNCSVGTDEGCDDDNDDYCDAAMTVVGKPLTCSKTDGGVSPGKAGNDCNDTALAVSPVATEVCGNSMDDNCSGSTDEGCLPETCNGADDDGNGKTDDVACGSGACTCATNSVATCPADCVTCPDEGDLAIAIDDAGVKKVVCAHDYPWWGIEPESPGTFADKGDGTVTDSLTGLQWQKVVDNNTYLWAPSKAYCDALLLGGKTDWRVPTSFELETTVDYSKTASCAVMPSAFGSYPCNFYWAASPFQGGSSFAWGVYFDSGYSDSSGITISYRVRCVR